MTIFILDTPVILNDYTSIFVFVFAPVKYVMHKTSWYHFCIVPLSTTKLVTFLQVRSVFFTSKFFQKNVSKILHKNRSILKVFAQSFSRTAELGKFPDTQYIVSEMTQDKNRFFVSEEDTILRFLDNYLLGMKLTW